MSWPCRVVFVRRSVSLSYYVLNMLAIVFYDMYNYT